MIKTRVKYPPFQYTPVKSHFCRIVVGSDQEMGHIGQDSHQLISIYLPFVIKVSEVLRHKSNHVEVLFVGLQ